jgi:UPF0271 protein
MLGKGISIEELSGLIVDQLITLQAICDEFGVQLHHVKPHGALYNRAARDPEVSAMVCRAIREFDPDLQLYGLSGSVMGVEAARHGLSFVNEVFADRTYQADGSLTPRTEPGALIENVELAVTQVMRMMEKGCVTTLDGKEIPIRAETICLHGDGNHAIAFAKNIYESLQPYSI